MLEPGKLEELSRRAVERALASGSLLTLETHLEIVPDRGIPFQVRTLSSLQRKEHHRVFERSKKEARTNPFLPFDPDLFVVEFSDTHICLLNKFNVVRCHLLMVTRDFERQELPLTIGDFQAVSACLREMDGLAFYNSNETAGASQPHKHLQFIPFDRESKLAPLPIESVLPSGTPEYLQTVKTLPYLNSFTHQEEDFGGDLNQVAERLHRTYLRLRDYLGDTYSSYNLLVTRGWMIFVPRSRESARAISVNSLGFIGSLLAKTKEEADWIRNSGPAEVLQQCGFPFPQAAET